MKHSEKPAGRLGHTLHRMWQDKLLDLINAVFGLLAILGIVNDPTTKGLGDSRRAMEYKTPN